MNSFLIIYIIISTLGLGMSIASHGQERKPENAWTTVVSAIITQSLVWGIYLTA